MKLVFENKKRMNEDSSKKETKELDYYEDVYDLDALYDHMTVSIGKRGKFTPEINLGAGAMSIGEARKLANNLLKVCDDAEKLSNKYKNNMKGLDESKKRMNESMSSDDIVEFFKKFLKEYYLDYRDNHKDDRRFFSALKSDLEEIIDQAITDFWFE